jgi:heterodisulfide reductase subunit B
MLRIFQFVIIFPCSQNDGSETKYLLASEGVLNLLNMSLQETSHLQLAISNDFALDVRYFYGVKFHKYHFAYDMMEQKCASQFACHMTVCPSESSCLTLIYIAVRFLSKSQILGSNSVEDQHPSKSVLDVLKEMSRKRIYAQVTIHIFT